MSQDTASTNIPTDFQPNIPEAAIPWLPCPIIGTCPTFPVPPACVGELHGSELRKAIRRYKLSGNDKNRFLKNEIGELCSKKLLQESEGRILNEVIDLTFKFDAGEREGSEKIRKLYEQLIDDNGSPVAIAIVGIAADSTRNKDTAKGTATADVAGGIAGAGVGGAVGGIGGAVLGGVIGGLATSLAWKVDND